MPVSPFGMGEKFGSWGTARRKVHDFYEYSLFADGLLTTNMIKILKVLIVWAKGELIFFTIGYGAMLWICDQSFRYCWVAITQDWGFFCFSYGPAHE